MKPKASWQNRLRRVESQYFALRGTEATLRASLKAAKKELGTSRETAELLSKIEAIFSELKESRFSAFASGLSDLATQAIQEAFGSGYSLAVSSVGSSGYRVEVTTPDGHTDSVAGSQGDGLSSIASVAMLLVCAYMSSRYPAGFLCLDEPFAGVDERRGEVYEWLADISKALGLQIIVIVHHKEALDSAESIVNLCENNSVDNLGRQDIMPSERKPIPKVLRR